MAPSHTVVDILDDGRALITPYAITTTDPPRTIDIVLLEVFESDPKFEVCISASMVIGGYKRSDRGAHIGAAVRIISPLEALARCST